MPSVNLYDVDFPVDYVTSPSLNGLISARVSLHAPKPSRDQKRVALWLLAQAVGTTDWEVAVNGLSVPQTIPGVFVLDSVSLSEQEGVRIAFRQS